LYTGRYIPIYDILHTKPMEPRIIFEDDYLIVLDKPPGWVVNEADTTKHQKVVQKWLVKERPYELAKNSELRSGIVHRLDKETSGVLVVAKKAMAFKDLQAQFKARKVKKTYTALVHGKVEPEKGTINAPVGRLPWNRERFGVLPGGRSAETKYKVVGYYECEEVRPFKVHLSRAKSRDYSLLTLSPKTGRTHQIRIHLKYLGHPIVSDEFYAGRKTARRDRIWCPRLFLHANKISFTHPEKGKIVSFKSKLPDDLQSCLKKLLQG